jgi:hypothetical protein
VYQRVDRRRIGRAGPAIVAGTGAHHELVFADIDFYDDRVWSHHASLRHRHSRPYASSGSTPFQLFGIIDD